MFYNRNFLFALALLSMLTTSLHAQIDTTIKLDLLRGPSSPASNLLGLSPSTIEKPSDVKAIMTSFKSATNNFSSLPKNYALDLAPFKIWGKKHLDVKYLDSSQYAFKQSAVLSFGLNSADKNDSVQNSVAKTQLGIGVKFSLVRGRLDKESREAIENIYALQKGDEDVIVRGLKNDSLLLIHARRNTAFKDSSKHPGESATFHRILDSLRQIDLRLTSEVLQPPSATGDSRALIKKEVERIKLERVGFNLDFSAGTVVDFIGNKFDNSRVTKTGAWLTGGWTGETTPTSILFIARYLYNPKTSFADPDLKQQDLHTLDGGARFIATPMSKKLLLSAEGIYRSILNRANATSSWRLVFNAEYEIGSNQRLTFSFGRNFDGEIYKGGNIISALHFIVGFGKEKVTSN